MTQDTPQPLYTPEVPTYATRMRIVDHVRILHAPRFMNALGNPDVHGPKDVVGIEYRCPVCQHIQFLGLPGLEHACGDGIAGRGCGMKYKYTTANGEAWLWVWKQQAPLVIDVAPGT